MRDIVYVDCALDAIHLASGAVQPRANTRTQPSTAREPDMELEETSATLPAPRGAANLALALAMAIALTAAAR